MNPVVSGHLRSFIAATDELSGHNRENSALSKGLGSLFSMMLGGMAPELAPTAKPSAKVDHLAQAEEIFAKYSSTLTAIGLELAQNRERFTLENLSSELNLEAIISTVPSNLREDKLELQLLDGDKLLNFLRTISPSTAAGPDTNRAVTFLAHCLDRELILKYTLRMAGQSVDDWEDLTKHLEDIGSELQRMNLKESAAVLNNHLERVWNGDLTEYLLAEHAGILSKGGFGPDKWHTDNTAVRYKEEYWDKALDTLEQMMTNPDAAKLCSFVHRTLSESAESAAIDIQSYMAKATINGTEYWTREGPGMLEVLEDVRTRLSALEREID